MLSRNRKETSRKLVKGALSEGLLQSVLAVFSMSLIGANNAGANFFLCLTFGDVTSR